MKARYAAVLLSVPILACGCAAEPPGVVSSRFGGDPSASHIVVAVKEPSSAPKYRDSANRSELQHHSDRSPWLWVTPGRPPAGKRYVVLGAVRYSEPSSTEAEDPNRMAEKLKSLALGKFPDEVDALIDENSEMSGDGKTITVSAKAIKYGPPYEQIVSPPPYEEILNPPET